MATVNPDCWAGRGAASSNHLTPLQRPAAVTGRGDKANGLGPRFPIMTDGRRHGASPRQVFLNCSAGIARIGSTRS